MVMMFLFWPWCGCRKVQIQVASGDFIGMRRKLIEPPVAPLVSTKSLAAREDLQTDGARVHLFLILPWQLLLDGTRILVALVTVRQQQQARCNLIVIAISSAATETASAAALRRHGGGGVWWRRRVDAAPMPFRMAAHVPIKSLPRPEPLAALRALL
ncbi:unnamed protein product [Cuscuta campestris]|uniref:Secreted protein n=1 Tax=Cuscuta campestris TaxID=132261 RepID=A0A484LQD2_9ASTE|nr:unnamed protein product [Cuscuta campestris]